jgi:hypothetical protein
MSVSGRLSKIDRRWVDLLFTLNNPYFESPCNIADIFENIRNLILLLQTNVKMDF